MYVLPFWHAICTKAHFSVGALDHEVQSRELGGPQPSRVRGRCPGFGSSKGPWRKRHPACPSVQPRTPRAVCDVYVVRIHADDAAATIRDLRPIADELGEMQLSNRRRRRRIKAAVLASDISAKLNGYATTLDRAIQYFQVSSEGRDAHGFGLKKGPTVKCRCPARTRLSDNAEGCGSDRRTSRKLSG